MDAEMDPPSNSVGSRRDSPPGVITADISAAMPPLPEDNSRDNPNPGNTPPQSQQQKPPQHPPDIIMNPPPNRVKRFVFRSTRKRSVAGCQPGANLMEQDCLSSSTAGSVLEGQGVRHQSSSTSDESATTEMDTLEVVVPERIQASYGLYVWPCAPILAWYLFEHRHHLVGKRVLELGAGTALPGVVASLCGAHVTLTDSAKLTHCLDQCKRTAEVNGVGDRVKVLGLTWGLFLNNLTRLKGQVDLLIGSDCFYDPAVFEDLISTAAYILETNPQAKFLCTYQERSADWSIEHLLSKWGLRCKHVPLSDLANSNQIDLLSLMQDHTIHLLEITRNLAVSSEVEPLEEDVEFS